MCLKRVNIAVAGLGRMVLLLDWQSPLEAIVNRDRASVMFRLS